MTTTFNDRCGTGLAALGGAPLRVDTGDPRLDRELSGYVRVVTGYREAIMAKVSA